MDQERLQADRQINQEFYRKLTVVGIPLILQQVIAVTLNLADTIMVGKVGEDALAAVGAANQVYFIFSVVIFGVFSGASVYAVQYWGIRDLTKLRQIIGIDYAVCLTLTIPAVIVFYVFAPFFVGLFTDDSLVIQLGVDYLRIACFSYFFSSMSFSITYNSRAIQDVTVPTIINGCAIFTNIVLNYLLIYGKFGFPQLGVEGAAYATLIARVLECIAMFLSVYVRREYPLKATLRELFSFPADLFRQVMKTAVPVIVTEGLWAVSISCIFAAYGKLGVAALAVSQVAMTVADLFQTVYYGFGSATSVLIGEVLGQGRKEVAYKYSINALKVTWVFNIVFGIALILIRGLIADIYDFEPATTKLLMGALTVYAFSMTPKMLDYMITASIFRAGGDTLFSMTIDIIFNMCIQVPLAWFSVLVLKLPLVATMMVVMITDVIKVFICYRRYFQKKWMNVFTGIEEQGEEL